MHPLGNVNAQKNRTNALLSRTGYARDGAISTGGRNVKPPEPTSANFKKQNLKTGGTVSGSAPKPRADKFARGGCVGKKEGTKVNVIVAPQGGGAPPPPPMPMGGAPMPVPPPPMAGPPPGAGPMPGGMDRGGRYAKGGRVDYIGPYKGATRKGDKAGYRDEIKPAQQRPNLRGAKHAKGGTVKMDAGAGSGEGRLEKVRKYGPKPPGKKR